VVQCYVTSALDCLYLVDVGRVTDVSETHAGLNSRIEVRQRNHFGPGTRGSLNRRNVRNSTHINTVQNPITELALIIF
jgi:hypothetical protein